MGIRRTSRTTRSGFEESERCESKRRPSRIIAGNDEICGMERPLLKRGVRFPASQPLHANGVHDVPTNVRPIKPPDPGFVATSLSPHRQARCTLRRSRMGPGFPHARMVDRRDEAENLRQQPATPVSLVPSLGLVHDSEWVRFFQWNKERSFFQCNLKKTQ